jgi:hypothetical protein
LEEQRREFDKIEKENVLAALDVQKREFELEKDKLVRTLIQKKKSKILLII